MSVLIISHMYPNEINPVYGSFVHDQAVAIKNKGIDVRVISPTPFSPPPLTLNPKWRKYALVPKEAVIDDIPVSYLRYFVFPRNHWLGLSSHSLYKALMGSRFQKVLGEAATIHAHTVFPDGLAAIELKRKFPDRKIVLTIHGADVQKKAAISKSVSARLQKCLAEVDIILVNSPKTRDLCLKLGKTDANKIKVIPNGLPDSVIARGREASAYKHRENKVVSVCNLVPEKALDVAIKAFAGLNSGWRYEIIGDGALKKELAGLAAGLGNSKITFSGQRDKNYVMDALSKARIYLMPSRNEAFGLAYLEALACGAPIIGTREQGASYIIEDGRQGLLVPVDDVDATAQALKKLMSDAPGAEKMGARGQELVEENFKLSTLADEIIGCYSAKRIGARLSEAEAIKRS